MAPRFRQGRRRGLIAGAAIGSAVAGRKAASAEQPAEPDSTQTEAPASDSYEAQLTEISGLKEKGMITEVEYEAKRKQILGL